MQCMMTSLILDKLSAMSYTEVEVGDMIMQYDMYLFLEGWVCGFEIEERDVWQVLGFIPQGYVALWNKP